MFYDTLAILIGVNLHNIQNELNVLTLVPAIDYYAEIHLTFWNSIFHTLFMPWTMFGAFLWIPAFLWMNPKQAYSFRRFILTIYVTHYAMIDLQSNKPYSEFVTPLVLILFSVPYYQSVRLYRKWYYQSRSGLFKIFVRGLVIMVTALCIQEYFGHYIGGDDASRVEGVPNAIMYACYYAVDHLRDYTVVNILPNMHPL